MKICVYGASSNIISADYISATEELGRQIGRRGHSLVYGAGAGGLMGAVARGVYETGGHITGVAPSFFNVDGVLFENCDEMIRTETMHERKKIMEDTSDAFIVLPGGMGTFEEFFEMLTLKQLGRHKKAIAILNLNNYYDPLDAMMENGISQGFMNGVCRSLYRSFDSAEAVLDYFESYEYEGFDVIQQMKGIKTDETEDR